jgi:putative N6-adenine-specific DNA methylase
MGLTVVKVRCNRSQLKAETSIQAVVHKAVAQRLCGKNKLARLPEGPQLPEGGAAELRVYVEKDTVSLLLDLSGEPLFKRGYRTEGGIAPLRETTAAALLLLSGWKRKYPLYDPFCGSGTILTEALLYAWDMAPGLSRNFALEKFLLADSEIEAAVREEFRGKVNFERIIRIAGSDGDARALSIAKSNIERARDLAENRLPPRGIRPSDARRNLPLLKMQSYNEARSPFQPERAGAENAGNEPAGFLVCNPPYGRRLGDSADSENIYSGMKCLGRNFPEWKLALITDHPGFESFFGRQADSCREIKNGIVPSYFYQYERLR